MTVGWPAKADVFPVVTCLSFFSFRPRQAPARNRIVCVRRLTVGGLTSQKTTRKVCSFSLYGQLGLFLKVCYRFLLSVIQVQDKIKVCSP